MRNVKTVILALTLSVLMLGCGISDQLVKSTENNIKLLDKSIKVNEKYSKNFNNSTLYVKHKVLADREGLSKLAEDLLKYNSTLVKAKSNLEEILKKDDSNDENNLRRLIKTSRDMNDKITKNRFSIEDKLNLYEDFKEKSFLWTSNALEKADKIEKNLNKLTDTIDSKKKLFPNRAKDIEARTNQQIAMIKESILHIKEINGEKDIVKFLKIKDFAANKTSVLLNIIIEKNNEIEELSNSKTRILKEARILNFIEGKVFSWDDYSDWNTEKSKVFNKIPISNEMANKINKRNIEMIASYPAFIGAYNCKTDKDICKIFEKIMVNREFASRGHTKGELYLNNIIYKYQFKYIDIENGKEVEHNWTEVTENVFYKYASYVGHEIMSKPYGVFANESMKQPNPVGISKVGNKEYGEWKKDPETGESFWSFYGKYMLFSQLINTFSGNNNHKYYRSDYNNWNTNYRNARFTGRENRYSYYGSNNYTSRGFSANNITRKYNNNRNFQQNRKINQSRSNISSRSGSARNTGAKIRARGASGGGK